MILHRRNKETMLTDHVIGEEHGHIHEGREWDPLLLINLVSGFLFLIFGSIALSRSHLDSLYTQVSVGGLHFTTLSGVISVSAGALVVLASLIEAPITRGILSVMG